MWTPYHHQCQNNPNFYPNFYENNNSVSTLNESLLSGYGNSNYSNMPSVSNNNQDNDSGLQDSNPNMTSLNNHHFYNYNNVCDYNYCRYGHDIVQIGSCVDLTQQPQQLPHNQVCMREQNLIICVNLFWNNHSVWKRLVELTAMHSSKNTT